MKLETINNPQMKISENAVPVSLDYLLENIDPLTPALMMYRILDKSKSVEIIIAQKEKEYSISREFSILSPGEYIRRVIKSLENI